MAATAEKTSKPAGTATRAPAEAFFGKARGGGFFAPARPAVQTKLTVSKPTDSLEAEADRTAERVMRSASPTAMSSTAPAISRAPAAPSGPVAAPAVESAATGGQPLPADLRAFLEPRLGADLTGVRVHDDSLAGSLSNQLSARAFTYRNHVFFARGQYQPGTREGVQLLAHELTHTIQQGQSKPLTPDAAVRPAATPAVQRLGVPDALDYFAGKADNLPGFRMLTLMLGVNPINRRAVPRTAANLLRAMIELIPGGALITQALDAHGVIDKAAAWAGQRMTVLGDIGGRVVDGLKRFVDSLSWSDIFDLGGVWDRAKRIFTDPIGALIAFITGVVGDILAMVRDATLRPLAGLAAGTRGWDLLKAVLGRDPITGEVCPRTAETVIGGFMKLIGQEEVWQNLKRGNAVARAWSWFTNALTGLMGMVTAVPGRILAMLRSLTFADVITVAGAFRKVAGVFAGIAGDFLGWGLRQVLGLLEILFSVVAPAVLPYVAKARTAFQTIVRDPVRFVGNLVRAGRLGFEMFAKNIGTHLKNALVKWLTGPLGEAGVYIPTAFTLLEIVKLVLSVLSLTWQNIRAKLVKIIPEPVLAALEKTAAVLVTLVTQGPAAAWEQIKAELTELKDQLIGQVTQMITTEVVKAAVVKLVSMLNPAGAVIQAIIATYHTVTFFIQKIQQIAAVVAAFVDSIAAIASGQVDAAAKKVEQTMAGTLTVIIAFLAKFAGLGNVPEKLVGIVKKIRQPIDKGLDRIVAWLGQLLQKIKAGAARLLEWWRARIPISGGDEEHVLTFEGAAASATLVVRSTPEKPSVFLDKAGKKAGKTDDERAKPVETAERAHAQITEQQAVLRDIDAKDGDAAAGKQATKADAAARELDVRLRRLASHIARHLVKWKVADDEVSGVTVPRDEFTVAQKRAIAEEHLAQGGDPKDLVADSQGRKINLRPSRELDRRHVVSADDMSSHYEEVLNKKKMTWSRAKLLIEQRGSTGSDPIVAVTPVGTPLSLAAIQEAARKRYAKFFGYAKNIFLGDSEENRSIQEHLDDGHPDLADGKLRFHVRRIKRSWALDGTFQETPVKKP
ncbi:DUF4157 domain-containing protein [Actinoplanes sp. NPDC026670]|uniref:eCIS core domain-containing protein n=1 Tax=Actinoplanes sp. NPDC026670 TaxID=3154700 RepID=UPI0033E61485